MRSRSLLRQLRKSWTQSLTRSPRREPIRRIPTPSGLARLTVERLEDRITPAPTLPTPVTGANQVQLIGQSQNANNQAPAVAVDPVNSNIVVTVWTQSSTIAPTTGQTFLIGGLSTNGGASYVLFFRPGPLIDP